MKITSKSKRRKSQEVIDLTTTCPYCLGNRLEEIGHWQTEGQERYWVFDHWECAICGQAWREGGEVSVDSVSEDPCPNCGAHWGRAFFTDKDWHPERYADDDDGPEDWAALHCNECEYTWPF